MGIGSAISGNPRLRVSQRQTFAMKRLVNWFLDRFRDDNEDDDLQLRPPAVSAKPRSPVGKPKPARPKTSVEFSSALEGRIEDGGPGKNVLIRNKYLREDTGTHETLKIIDDSILEGDDKDGIDPYNTGRFDRSKSWDSFRNRK